MLEVLEFVFSSFWVWLGTVILLGVVAAPFARLITIVRKERKPKEIKHDNPT